MSERLKPTECVDPGLLGNAAGPLTAGTGRLLSPETGQQLPYSGCPFR
jgi:hypothetical protein